jgi:hypothetical protein
MSHVPFAGTPPFLIWPWYEIVVPTAADAISNPSAAGAATPSGGGSGARTVSGGGSGFCAATLEVPINAAHKAPPANRPTPILRRMFTSITQNEPETRS